MPAPPSYQKVNPADQPILYMAVHSDTLPPSTVDDYADTLMAQRISMISGVAQVQLYGAQKYAVRVQLDPQALATRGIGIDEVTDAIKNANVNLPTGTLFGTHKPSPCRPTASSRTPPLTGRSSSPIATARRCVLEALGQVIDSVQNNKVVTWYNGHQRPWCWPSSASPAPTPSRWWTTSSACCRPSAQEIPAVHPPGHPLRQLRFPFATPWTTSSSRST